MFLHAPVDSTSRSRRVDEIVCGSGFLEMVWNVHPFPPSPGTSTAGLRACGSSRSVPAKSHGWSLPAIGDPTDHHGQSIPEHWAVGHWPGRRWRCWTKTDRKRLVADPPTVSGAAKAGECIDPGIDHGSLPRTSTARKPPACFHRSREQSVVLLHTDGTNP